MKVIIAGMPKTGTKTMQAALTDLGYKVYDFEENCFFLGNEWRKICLEGGTTNDFYRMYKDVDAVTDVPPCYYWDEIHKAFPDSKIILTMRDSEEVWINSFRRQMKEETQLMMMLLMYLSPTMYRVFKFGDIVATAVFGTSTKYSLFGPCHINELLVRMTYRRHNSHVMQTAPRDKLLIYNVKEGWEPLCKFLKVDVPEKPFPRKNVRGNLINEYLKEHPLFQRCKKEMAISTVCLSLLVGYGGYKLFRKSTVLWIRSSVFGAFQVLQDRFCLTA